MQKYIETFKKSKIIKKMILLITKIVSSLIVKIVCIIKVIYDDNPKKNLLENNDNVIDGIDV
jgi:hypothetical protein